MSDRSTGAAVRAMLRWAKPTTQRNATMKLKLTLLIAPLALAGCQTIGPTWSELSGERYYNTTTPDRRVGVIVKVDERGAFGQNPIKVEPGTHRIVMEAPSHGRFRGGDQRELTLNLEPCKRYLLNSQFKNPVQPDWTPVVDYVEPIAGCKAG